MHDVSAARTHSQKRPPEVEDRGVRLMRAMTQIFVPAVWAAAVVMIFPGKLPNFLIGLICAVLFTVPAVLIRMGRFRAAKCAFLFQFLVPAFLIPLAIGRQAYTEWIVLLLPPLTYLLFENNRHWLHLGLGVAYYTAIRIIYVVHVPWWEPALQLFYESFLMIAASVFVYWMMVVFKRESVSAEQIILDQHNELLKNQQALAQRHADLLAANDALESQRHTLEQLNTELRHFAYAASHDMKEPLRNMGSFSHLLSRRLAHDPESRELLQFIEDGAKRMTRLLDDLISFARVGTGNAPTDAVNLNDVLDLARLNLRLQLQQTGGAIESQPLPTLAAHRTLLLQLFQNLIANGLKYRRADVPPLVQIRFEKKDDGTLFFVLSDNGIGIAPEYLERIFEPFRRLHNRGEYDGSGIGLATCRKIAEMYGGKIWAESQPGAGAIFCLELPGAMLIEKAQTAEKEALMAAA